MQVVGDLAVDVLLRGAGLAADAVSGDVGIAAAAVFHGVLQQVAHDGGGLLGDGGAQDLLAVALDHFALVRQDLLDDVGLEQLAAVDRGAARGQKLHGRDGDALAEGHAGDVHVLYVFIGDHLAARGAGEVDGDLHADAEVVQPVVEGVDAHAQRQLHEHGVAGVGHRVHQRLGPMGVARAPAGDLVAVDDGVSLAVEGVVHAGDAVLQRKGRCQDLEGGAGLIGVLHAGVAHQGGQLRQVVARRVVQVEVRLVDHAQDLAGLDVHHHDLHALGARFLQRLLGHALHDGLDDVVHRQANGVPVFGRDVLLLARLHPARARVDLGHDAPVRSAQVLVQALFQPFLPFARDRAEPQHLRQERAHRVDADRVLAHGDALQVCGLHLVAQLDLDLAR